jgi:N6-adenosine-specific RNA methylase IME4
MTQPVITIDGALRALASATTPDELIQLSNQAAALQVYARRAKLGMVAQNRCAEIRLRAERKLGELLTTTPRLHGRPKSVPDENTLPRLSDFGISRKLSHRVQRLAAIPQLDFDSWLRQAHHHQREITTRLLLTICEQRQAAVRNRRRIVGGRVDDLGAFARNHKMGCIMIDPPLAPNRGWAPPYMTMSLEELQRLPIHDLASPDRCHLHVWTLPNEYMFALKPIIDGWGFRLVSSLAWVKPAALGRGNYWRISHEILLTAVLADRDDRFDDRGLRSWIEAPRGRHSEKPDAVREMIERASPGPRLELFARKVAPGWFAWGHEIAKPLTDQAAA